MLYLLLAAYNEAENLPEIYNDILAQQWPFPYQIILVDDGSTDATLAITRQYQQKLPIHVIQHAVNQGLGRALRSGFSFLLETMHEPDWVATLDADATHPVSLIPHMMDVCAQDNDIVIASRYHPQGKQTGLSWLRQFLSAGVNALLRIFWPIKGVKDYSSGFRVYSGRIAGKLGKKFGADLIEEQGFAASVELILKARGLSPHCAEVPLHLKYENKKGRSKMRILQTVYRYCVLIVKLSVNTAR